MDPSLDATDSAKGLWALFPSFLSYIYTSNT